MAKKNILTEAQFKRLVNRMVKEAIEDNTIDILKQKQMRVQAYRERVVLLKQKLTDAILEVIESKCGDIQIKRATVELLVEPVVSMILSHERKKQLNR